MIVEETQTQDGDTKTLGVAEGGSAFTYKHIHEQVFQCHLKVLQFGNSHNGSIRWVIWSPLMAQTCKLSARKFGDKFNDKAESPLIGSRNLKREQSIADCPGRAL